MIIINLRWWQLVMCLFLLFNSAVFFWPHGYASSFAQYLDSWLISFLSCFHVYDPPSNLGSNILDILIAKKTYSYSSWASRFMASPWPYHGMDRPKHHIQTTGESLWWLQHKVSRYLRLLRWNVKNSTQNSSWIRHKSFKSCFSWMNLLLNSFFFF